MDYDDLIEIFFSSVYDINTMLKNMFSSSICLSDGGKYNKSGDLVHRLDYIANDILKLNFMKNKELYALASEEEEDIIYINGNGKYLFAYDPLDGSNNIDLGLNTGTIFGIFKVNNDGKITSGRDLVCAGYALYGSNVQIVIADNYSVKYYNMIDNKNPIVIDSQFKINNNIKSKFYAVNESSKFNWINEKTKIFVDNLVKNGKSGRWSGCMVADIHRLIVSCGVFMYPMNNKNKRGKLRLLYECYPMAYIVERMGGKGLIEDKELNNILDYPFNMKNPHEKVPVIYSTLEDLKCYPL